MKAILRIPTQEQYAYIELVEVEGTPEEIVAQYQEMRQLVSGNAGLDPKQFNAVLDEYLSTNKITADPGIVELMDIDQNSIIQAIKRSRARTK